MTLIEQIKATDWYKLLQKMCDAFNIEYELLSEGGQVAALYLHIQRYDKNDIAVKTRQIVSFKTINTVTPLHYLQDVMYELQTKLIQQDNYCETINE